MMSWHDSGLLAPTSRKGLGLGLGVFTEETSLSIQSSPEKGQGPMLCPSLLVDSGETGSQSFKAQTRMTKNLMAAACCQT